MIGSFSATAGVLVIFVISERRMRSVGLQLHFNGWSLRSICYHISELHTTSLSELHVRCISLHRLYWPIFNILSLAHSSVNLQWTNRWTSNHSSYKLLCEYFDNRFPLPLSGLLSLSPSCSDYFFQW